MKDLQYVLGRYTPQCIDARDMVRIAQFLPDEQLHKIGFSIKEGSEKRTNIPEWNRENILENLKGDIAFGFEKALNKRGISSLLMFNVVLMWNWILEEGLEDYKGPYEQYGLPLFKATAEKYGFPNPIGSDSGSEEKYASL